MKKLAAILTLILGVTFSSQAQKHKKGDFEQMSDAQRTELALKKMTLKLDLTSSQQRQIKPLLAEKIAHKKKMREERTAQRKSEKKLSADERFEKISERLDRQIAHKADMKRILNEKQYERFEKMHATKKRGMKKRMKKHHRKA